MTSKRLEDGWRQQIAEFFHGSRLQYLALDHGSQSIRLSRPEPSTVLAATVGTVAAGAGRARYPAPGESVAQGDTLFVIRRFRNDFEVKAPATGTLAAVLVPDGAFVEYGQPLAHID